MERIHGVWFAWPSEYSKQIIELLLLLLLRADWFPLCYRAVTGLKEEKEEEEGEEEEKL